MDKNERKKAQMRLWRKNNPEKAKAGDRNKYLKMMKNNPDQKLNQTLKDRYGITLSQYNQMLANQNGTCAICGRTAIEALGSKSQAKRLYVDPCHITGHVRGLLCRDCNLGIGFFQENPNVLQSAQDYVTENIIKTEF